jgi:hypothetical protein
VLLIERRGLAPRELLDEVEIDLGPIGDGGHPASPRLGLNGRSKSTHASHRPARRSSRSPGARREGFVRR